MNEDLLSGSLICGCVGSEEEATRIQEQHAEQSSVRVMAADIYGAGQQDCYY